VNLSGLIQIGDMPVFQIAEECFDRCQPRIAGASGIAALSFDVFQEGENQRRIHILDLDLRGPYLQPLDRKTCQQLIAVGIGLAGVGAGFALTWQVLAKKGVEVFRQGTHWAPPTWSASPEWAICRNSTGVARKYHHVSVTREWPR